jgi:hypothetical protein
MIASTQGSSRSMYELPVCECGNVIDPPRSPKNGHRYKWCAKCAVRLASMDEAYRRRRLEEASRA